MFLPFPNEEELSDNNGGNLNEEETRLKLILNTLFVAKH
ncbi:MAG: hypothetical protein ACJAUE_002722 [Alcanivorax sp.]|jgi:hypothetical protein